MKILKKGHSNNIKHAMALGLYVFRFLESIQPNHIGNAKTRWRSGSQQSHGGVPERNKNSQQIIGEITFGGVFVVVNVVSLKYIVIVYINVGEMCFIPMNVHNELFNGVRQLRWQHLSPVVSTCSTSIRLLSSLFIKHCILLPPSLSLSVHISLSFCRTTAIPLS